MEAMEAWARWRTFLRSQMSPKTVRDYTKILLEFIAETGAKRPEEVTEDDCASYLAEFAPRGAAKHMKAKALRSFFRWCVRHRAVAVDPMLEIRVRKPARRPPVTLTADELCRLLVAAVFTLGEREAWALLLMYLLGLRRIELAGLRWDDVMDGEDGPVIEINHTKAAELRDPLPLTPLALECLARLRELPVHDRIRLGPEYVVGVQEPAISGWAHAAGVAAGLNPRKIGSHRLRASLATNLLRAGVDVRVVQKTLGHLRLESTAWYLAEADEQAVRRGLELLPVAV